MLAPSHARPLLSRQPSAAIPHAPSPLTRLARFVSSVSLAAVGGGWWRLVAVGGGWWWLMAVQGEPRVPAGVEMGGFCRAMGKRAGERIPFKAVLLSTRRTAPPLLVRYVGTVDGREGSAILLPESTKGYLSYREVKRWVAPPPAPAGVVASFGLPSAAAERVFRTRLPPKGALELLTEAGGLRLYLDDRRMMDGYAGTGYEGVSYDYWPTGYKKLKPYVVTFEGSYAGRFATVEQAAVQYARLEEGLPPMSFDARAEFEASVYE